MSDSKFNNPSSPSPQRIVSAGLAAYLEAHWQTPEEYILRKFESRAIVMLAEDHAIRHNLMLVKNLIPHLHAAGVYNLGMEFGAAEDQAALDRLTNADRYDEDLARRLMFHYNVGWAYKEYTDLYRKAWELNRTLPEPVHKFRLLNLSYVYDWSRAGWMRTPYSASEIFHKGSTEVHRAGVTRREVLERGEKMLVLTGTPHAFTRYRYPIYEPHMDGFCRFDSGDFGNLLYQEAPEKVCTVLLHQPFPDKRSGYTKLIEPAGGAIDELFRAYPGKRAGFDLPGTPFGWLTDDSYYATGYVDFRLEQLADGYIYEKPFSEFQGCTIDEQFLSEENWPEAQSQYPDPDWRPRPGSLAEYWAQIRAYVDIGQRYQSLWG